MPNGRSNRFRTARRICAGTPLLMLAFAATAGPVANFSRTTVGFGNSSLDHIVQPVFVTNTGDAPLNLSAMTLSGPNAAEFILGGTCVTPITLQPGGGRCRIDLTISLSPGGSAARAATLTIQSDGSPPTTAIAVSATYSSTAPPPSVAPSWIDFPPQAVGTSSPTQTFTFTNPFFGTLTLTTPFVYQGDSGDFVATSDCGTVAIGGACTVAVGFVPTTTGPRATEVEIDFISQTTPPTTRVHRYSVTGVGGVAGPVAPTSVVEYYNAALDHYFITWVAAEQANLDAGNTPTKWTRTGYSFNTYTLPQAGTSPVCRYYIPPAKGDSHFFGRGTAECAATGQQNPTFVLEDSDFMNMLLPTAGVCPPGTRNVYRVFSNRPDANHRYMTDKTVRDEMVRSGWLAEGDGPDLVVMCSPV